jgi:hypothetical protein
MQPVAAGARAHAAHREHQVGKRMAARVAAGHVYQELVAGFGEHAVGYCIRQGVQDGDRDVVPAARFHLDRRGELRIEERSFRSVYPDRRERTFVVWQRGRHQAFHRVGGPDVGIDPGAVDAQA